MRRRASEWLTLPYVRQMTKEQVAATDAMVNMDTLGLAPTEVWASHADKRLAMCEILGLADQLKVPISGVDVDKIGSTDSEEFFARKIPSITIHFVDAGNLNARHPSHIERQTLSYAAR